MRFRMFMLAVVGAAAITPGAPPAAAKAQGEEITSTVIPLDQRQPPSAAEIDRVCKFVAKDPSVKQTGEWNQSGLIDVNNDGIKENVTMKYEGTMRVESFDIKSPDGNSISIELDGFEWKDYWSFGAHWLTYEGHTYKVNFKGSGGEQPSHLTYVDPDNTERVLCAFKNEVHLQIVATEPAYTNICRAAQDGALTQIRALEPLPERLRNAEALRARDYSGGFDVVGPVFAVDFDNNGKKDVLVKLEHHRTGGRGCSSASYRLIGQDGRAVEKSETRKLLDTLQGFGTNWYDPYYGPCITGKKFLSYKDKVYFEVKDDKDNKKSYALTLMEKGKIEKLCESTRTVRTTVNP